jgi:hypothetical protein
MISVILFVIALIGALVYALTDGKLSAVAKDVFWTAILAFFLSISGLVKLIS